MSELTIREYQQLVDNWINTRGVRYFSQLTQLALLVEEVGEVARIMARIYGEQIFKAADEDYDLADELADIFFVIVCIANKTDIDLAKAVLVNLDKKTRRDKEQQQKNEKLTN